MVGVVKNERFGERETVNSRRWKGNKIIPRVCLPSHIILEKSHMKITATHSMDDPGKQSNSVMLNSLETRESEKMRWIKVALWMSQSTTGSLSSSAWDKSPLQPHIPQPNIF